MGGTNWASDAMLMQPFALSDEAQDDTDAARMLRYRSYLDFFDGAQWTDKRKPGERRLTVNYARTFVHKGASYLMGRPVRFELIPNKDSQAGEDAAGQVEAALNEIWQDNALALVDYDAAV